MESFSDKIKSLANIPDDQVELLVKIAKPKKIRKGDFFVQAGEIPKQVGFNLNGLFRYFYPDKDGHEFTKGFILENNFIVSYSAMILHHGSYFFIEALEDSDIVSINYQDWKKLINQHPCWSPLIITLLEKAFIKKEKRERELLLDDAETRYRTFLQEYPNLEHRLKQYYIASYLGITPVALSRIRRKMHLLT